MDVLIRDFKKPKSCGSCPFVAFYSRPEDRRCTLRQVEDPELSKLAGQKVNTWVKVTKDKVYKGCPLVEVKSHGRLIDADKLLPESGYDPMMFQPKYGGDHRTQYNTLMGYEIFYMVNEAPTILEAST